MRIVFKSNENNIFCAIKKLNLLSNQIRQNKQERIWLDDKVNTLALCHMPTTLLNVVKNPHCENLSNWVQLLAFINSTVIQACRWQQPIRELAKVRRQTGHKQFLLLFLSSSRWSSRYAGHRDHHHDGPGSTSAWRPCHIFVRLWFRFDCSNRSASASSAADDAGHGRQSNFWIAHSHSTSAATAVGQWSSTTRRLCSFSNQRPNNHQ